MSKFNIGDIIKRIDSDMTTPITLIMKDTGKKINDTYKVSEVSTTSNICVEGSSQNTNEDFWEIVEKAEDIKDKLVNKNMEIDEIKKFDKSVLNEANEEVLEEIANEQKEIAKKKLKELYQNKKEAEDVASAAAADLKDITKDLKDLTPKK